MNKRAVAAVALCGLLLIASVCIINFRMEPQTASGLPAAATQTTIIIDAGHGGFDGGAVGLNGVDEKDINLAVALKLNKLLADAGYTTMMTRTEDISLEDEGVTTIKKRKTSDLHNRMALMERYEKVLFISIHQNSYNGGDKASGTQVFYSPKFSEESRALAEAIQNSVRTMVQPTNTRVVKEAGSSIYLLYSAVKPAVMVECGFLSDHDENLRLCDDGYQNELARAVALGIQEYLIVE